MILLVWVATSARAQAPADQQPPAEPASTVPQATPSGAGQPASGSAAEPDAGAASPLAPLAWLEGCWQGRVNQREFREHWLPLRGGMLIGVGQQVLSGRVQDYEFLRLDARVDGIYFTQFSGDRKETSFRLDGMATDDKDTIFTFAHTEDAFPARLVYRRGVDGWLYETIEGTLNGTDRKVIYPLRRIDCESGELILK